MLGRERREESSAKTPLTTPLLSKRQQRPPGGRGGGGQRDRQVGTYIVLPECKIIRRGSALEMQSPRLHPTPEITAAQGVVGA